MLRYALFTYESYYPSGGWRDFRGSFASVEEARNIPIIKGVCGMCFGIGGRDDENAQVVDLQTGVIVLIGHDGKWSEPT